MHTHIYMCIYIYIHAQIYICICWIFGNICDFSSNLFYLIAIIRGWDPGFPRLRASFRCNKCSMDHWGLGEALKDIVKRWK